MHTLVVMDVGFFDGVPSPAWGLFSIGVYLFAVWVVTMRVQTARRRKDLERLKTPVDEKLEEILELSKRLAMLNSSVKADFDLQLEATRTAQSEAKTAEELANLSAGGRAAAAALVRAEVTQALGDSTKDDRRFQWALLVISSLVSFGLGIVTAIVT